MPTSIVSNYKKLVIQHVLLQQEEAEAKARYESILSDRKKVGDDMAKLEAALQFGESLMATAPTAPTASGTPPPVPSGDGGGNGPRKSIRDLVLLIPRDGDAARADLLTGLALSSGTLNSRLMDAKKRGYIETAGRGRYKLTDKGKAVHGLHLVAPVGT